MKMMMTFGLACLFNCLLIGCYNIECVRNVASVLAERRCSCNHVAGVIGGGAGLVSKHRKAHPNIPTVYATNFAIVAGCYCGT